VAIDAVVFDIGNVLLTWQPETWYDRTYGRARRETLFAEADLAGMNLSIDGGADFRGTVYALADAHPGWATEIRDWHDNWLGLAGPVIDRSVRLLRALKRRGVPVFALTNFGAGSFELARGSLDFLSEFDRTYVSGQLRLLKPDPAIYAAVEADCGIAPAHLLFIDDKPENIAAAQARGWQVHLFDAPEGLARRLVAEGLLPQEEAR
jgi:2-haloacid dehalogenase